MSNIKWLGTPATEEQLGQLRQFFPQFRPGMQILPAPSSPQFPAPSTFPTRPPVLRDPPRIWTFRPEIGEVNAFALSPQLPSVELCRAVRMTGSQARSWAKRLLATLVGDPGRDLVLASDFPISLRDCLGGVINSYQQAWQEGRIPSLSIAAYRNGVLVFREGPIYRVTWPPGPGGSELSGVGQLRQFLPQFRPGTQILPAPGPMPGLQPMPAPPPPRLRPARCPEGFIRTRDGCIPCPGIEVEVTATDPSDPNIVVWEHTLCLPVTTDANVSVSAHSMGRSVRVIDRFSTPATRIFRG